MPLRLALTLLAVLFGLLSGSAIHAGGGPQNVAVIVNPNDQTSLAVANAYIELREIPPLNVFYIPWVTVANPRTTGVQFRDKVLKPILDQIQQRRLTAQIDCVAFSTGYPYLIDCQSLFPGKQFPRESRPMTSLTSATFLHQFLLTGREAMFQPNANLYFVPTVGGKTKSQAFMGAPPWSPGEEAPAAEGRAYLLATALGVMYQRGNTVDEIIASLKRARMADAAKPPGTIYYMKNNDVRSRVRHDTYPTAIQELRAIGVKAELLQGAAPPGKADVAGLTTGSPRLSLKASKSTLLPGALVDNFTSGGGGFVVPPTAPNPQTPISEFIRSGAAGASGTIIEPFAIPAKFPSAALHVHYARGCSLAEAFYQSVAGPCHLIVVGDPLCQPWATPPKVSVDGAPQGAPIAGQVQLTPSVAYPDGRTASRFELYIDGKQYQSINAGARFNLATGAIADGWHELRVVAIDNTPIAVQGAWTAEVHIKNGRDAVQLILGKPARFAATETFSVEVASTRQREAVVMHNGRRLGVVAGGKGRLQVDAKQLGKGRVKLYAQQAGEPPLRSRVVVAEIY